LISGTEYQKTLRTCFSVLSEDDKRKYVNQVLDYFNKQAQDNGDQKWHIKYGWQILSSICGQLTNEESAKCEKAFGRECDPKFEPEPSIGEMRGGLIRPRGPITLEEFSELPIADIAKKLRTEWKPEKLHDQNTGEDFLNPMNAEGVGELLKADIAKRFQDYIENAGYFFERGVLDQHYTCSYLRGLQEVFRGKKTITCDVNWDGFITMCMSIITSGESAPFDREARDREVFGAWLASWIEVLSTMADIVRELISGDDAKIVINFPKYRNSLFAVICNLLTYPDPIPDDEKIESAKIKVKSPDSEDYLVIDPFTIAINTVRGRAFQALALFVYQDGKQYSKESKSQLSPDVKRTYEQFLKRENTQALMFMLGHYLPSFYFRDKVWMQPLIPQIFPADPDKKDLYLASWEGYLTTNLYKEIFVLFKDLYDRAIKMNAEYYTKRRYHKYLDEALAIHMAFAFTHFEDFGIESDLFKAFWEKKNTKRHKEFISFIGRHCISREHADLWIKEHRIDLGKLKVLWDFVLDTCEDKEVLAEFGFWMDTQWNVFDMTWLAKHMRRTLEKSGGDIDWEYGMMKSLPILAKVEPAETIEILSLYFKNKATPGGRGRGWFHVGNEQVEIFKTLYQNPATRDRTHKLVNELLPLGNGQFWQLKEALN